MADLMTTADVNNANMTGDPTDLAVEAPATAHPQENMKKKSLSVGMPSPENVVRQPKHKKRNAIMESSTTPPKPKTMTGPVLLMSPTFVDSDLARPSRNVVRPVRLGDQLEQAEENLAIMRLPSSGSTQLPYEMDSLAWNKQHTANEQVGQTYLIEDIDALYAGVILLLWSSRRLVQPDGLLCPMLSVVSRAVPCPATARHADHPRRSILAFCLRPL